MNFRTGARFRIATVQWFIFLVTCLCIVFYHATDTFAAIPLITDDTGTMGTGKFQLELFGEYGHDQDQRITAKTSDLSMSLTYGIVDPLDIIISIPYQFWQAEASGSMREGDGFSDLAIEAKWRFYEKDGVSLALKPGLTFPTGDDGKGLGTGRVTAHLYFIASKEMNPWAFHLNLAYIRNENRTDQRTTIWHASFASTVDVMKDLKLVGDVGAESNPDGSSKTPSAYVLGGVSYSLRENLEIGLGVKGGLTKPEKDISVRGGVTWGF